MKVIFMGTPDFSVGTLEALIESGHEVVLAVTQPDKPKGRGKAMQFPPVKEAALAHEIEVYQPKRVREQDCIQYLGRYEADIIVVVAFGQILPREILKMPRYGCINVHASLLPRYRGAAPIQWAVINGEKTAGVTTMFMAEGMDTGDMLLKSETEVGPEETSGELFDRLKLLGAKLLTETLDKLEQGELKAIPQDGTQATLAPLLKKEMSALDWSEPAQRIHDRIRGLNPWPCAAADLDGKRVKLLASQVIEGEGVPGTAYNLDGELAAACGRGMLRITELQADTGKRMSGKDYLLGHPLKEGTRFE